MDVLRELIQVSGHLPTARYPADLLEMANSGLSRAEALHGWMSLGRTESSFYSAYKSFKDDLVRMAFLDRKTPGQTARRMDVWERLKVVNQLLIAGKKCAAVALATELVLAAQKTGFTEVVVNAASILELHYGSIEVDTRRYLRYRKIRKEFAQMMADELEVKGLKARLVHSIERKKDWKALEPDIRELMAKPTGSFTYLRQRFTVLCIWHERRADMDGLLTAFRETLAGYETSTVEVTDTVLSNLYFYAIPILAKAARYAEAEAHISKALQAQRPGTQNWHLFLLQRACLGHVSGKAGMVRAALAIAQAAPVEHENPQVGECWARVQRLLDGETVVDVWGWVMG